MEWWIINDELIFHPLLIIGFLDCLWFLDRFRKTYSGPEDWHAFIRQLYAFLAFFFSLAIPYHLLNQFSRYFKGQ